MLLPLLAADCGTQHISSGLLSVSSQPNQYTTIGPIASRVTLNAGCPKCSLKTRKRRHRPTFEQDRHPVMQDWDHERNAADSIFPHNTTHGRTS